MKKLTRMAALVLALVMCMSVSAFAANTETENDLAKITAQNGASVTFASLNDGEEKIQVTYQNADAIKEGGYYLVMMIDAQEGGATFIPTKDSILYIDQTTGSADGTVSFAVYPSSINDSAILIYGMDSGKLIAAVIEAKYLIGDVDNDGAVTASDAAVIFRAVVGTEALTSKQKKAGNVDTTDAGITAADAAKILRVVAGLSTLG